MFVMLTSWWECGIGCHRLWNIVWFKGKFFLIFAPKMLPHLHKSFILLTKTFVLLFHELYILKCFFHVYNEDACLYGKFSMTRLLFMAKECCLMPLTTKVLLNEHLECQIYGYEKSPF